MMNTQFYSLSEVVYFPERRTKTEVLWNSLRLIEPELEDVCLLKNIPPAMRDEMIDEMMLRGMYCLYIGNTVVSVAILKRNIIDRIITIPQHRRKGYASILIKLVTGAMKRAGIPCVFSPVRSDIVPLFVKLGWVKCGTGALDGTFDYCPADDLPYYREMTPVDVAPWITHLLFQQKHLLHPDNRRIPA